MEMKRIGLAVLGVFLLAGCRTVENYDQIRVTNTVQHYEQARYKDVAPDHVLKLEECVRLAVANNLDLKVVNLEEDVARDMRLTELLGMLPSMTIANTYSARNNVPASSSEELGNASGPGTFSYSQSQDKNINLVNVDIAMSVFDFGLACFNSQQANDRFLIRKMRTRRAEQNLVLDTVRAYFQVAAAQRAKDITAKLLKECQNRYELIEKMGDSGRITPFRAFEEVRRFIDMEKRLANYVRNYDNACVELRLLLGLYPNTEIKVDDSLLDKTPEFKFPEMELMEQIALMKRPELMEQDIQRHLNVVECRKAILLMFPNVRMFVDFTNSNNSYLYNKSWWEVGVRASYNLFDLPKTVAKYQAYGRQVTVEEARAYAQSIGIMAQVRIAYANLVATKERLDLDYKINDAYSKNLKKALGSGRISGEMSQLELDHMRLATAETEIERILSVGNYYVSYFRVLNTLGVGNLTGQSVDELKAALDAERERAKAELDAAKQAEIADGEPTEPVAEPETK